ncbi:MAG TPA: Ig-like domain-containing protein [Nakamurella sp.]|nr:Ig-like domain-containing protein [Nakamurella sp.]
MRQSRIGRKCRRTARYSGLILAAVAAMILSGCTSSSDEVVTVTSTAGAAGSAPGLGGSQAPTGESDGLSSTVRVSVNPKFGSKDVSPTDPVTLTVFSATIKELKVTADDGTEVTGKVSDDKATWTLAERLAFNTRYTFDGIAVAADGTESPISGSMKTIKPQKTIRASFQIPKGATVGIAAPVIITFAEAIEDRAAAQATFTLTTDKGKIKGSWGWLQDEDTQGNGVKQSIVHFRPAAFWPAHTKVHVEAKLAGVNYGNGEWGREDIATDFTIGRGQIVRADVSTHRMVVLVDDHVVKNYPVSYGKDAVIGRNTVSGTHVVTQKFPEYSMCNPEYAYCNVTEKWAVRINNNGEFIHENALTTPFLGKENVSHGCINMGVGDAQEYYDSALYGDPVVVTGTGAPMTERDSIYDWIYSYDDWQTLSAL